MGVNSGSGFVPPLGSGGGGGGATLADTFVGFGSASNLLTGSSDFTYSPTNGFLIGFQGEVAGYFNKDISGIVVLLGDAFNSANSTKIGIQDSGHAVVISSGTGTMALFSNERLGGLVASIGDVFDTAHSTIVRVDDINQLVTISNVPTFANDAAATGGGLTTGQLYKTTTVGITSLNIVP